MASKSYDEILKEIKNKIYHPVYLLQGEEPYFIDQIAELIEKSVLDDMEKEFNQTVIYGRDCDTMQLISTAKRYPMMANYQVVIVREAAEIKDLFSGRATEDAKEALTAYLNAPLSSTILVICLKYKSVDKRWKMYKAFEKSGVVFDAKRLYEDKIPAWIEKHLAGKGYKIQPQAAMLMAESLGIDLSKISNECDKLIINLKAGETITSQHIETNIGISKEFNIFELQRALGQRDVLKANRIVNYFRDNPKSNPVQVSMANFYSYFSKLLLIHSLKDKSQGAVASALKIPHFYTNDYIQAARNFPPGKLGAIISHLREYDMKFKGVGSTSNTENGELMRELLFKILHA